MRNSIFERWTLFFQKEINIRFEVHDPAMVLQYIMSVACKPPLQLIIYLEINKPQL
jgi:hypothetical protein